MESVPAGSLYDVAVRFEESLSLARGGRGQTVSNESVQSQSKWKHVVFVGTLIGAIAFATFAWPKRRI